MPIATLDAAVTLQCCSQSGLHGVAVFAGYVLGSEGPGSLHAGSRGRGRTSGWNLRHGGRIMNHGADPTLEGPRIFLPAHLPLISRDPVQVAPALTDAWSPGPPPSCVGGSPEVRPPLPSLVLKVSQSSEV